MTQRENLTLALESLKILENYFEVQFDFVRLHLHYPKRSISQLEDIVRNQIKQIVIDLQSQLFNSRQIHCFKLSQNYTPKVFKQCSNLQKILDEKSHSTFVSLYSNRINSLTNMMAAPDKFPLLDSLKDNMLLQISSSDKLYLYQQFMQYSMKRNLFTQLTIPSSTTIAKNKQPTKDLTPLKEYEQQLLNTGYVEAIDNVYSKEELHVIFNCYIKMKGRINEVVYQIQGRGLTGYKFSQKVVMFKLENIKLIGLYYIYKCAFAEIDGIPLNWRQFKQIYGDIFMNWDQSILQKLIRCAIYNDPTIQEIKDICLKLGRSYLLRYQGFNGKSRMPKLQINSFQNGESMEKQQNGVMSSIKNEMRKMLFK